MMIIFTRYTRNDNEKSYCETYLPPDRIHAQNIIVVAKFRFPSVRHTIQLYIIIILNYSKYIYIIRMRWYFYCNTHALSQFTYISDHKTLEMTVYQYIILYFVRVNVIRVLIYYTFFIFMNYDFWKCIV